MPYSERATNKLCFEVQNEGMWRRKGVRFIILGNEDAWSEKLQKMEASEGVT